MNSFAAFLLAASGASTALARGVDGSIGFAEGLAPLRDGPAPPESAERADEKAADAPLFTSPVDGCFDISGFLATRTGFLPIVMPITEPAVGYGLAVGLTFFHGQLNEGEGGRWGLPLSHRRAAGAVAGC